MTEEGLIILLKDWENISQRRCNTCKWGHGFNTVWVQGQCFRSHNDTLICNNIIDRWVWEYE